jgi:subtilisin-like proprotein convertase family protein
VPAGAGRITDLDISLNIFHTFDGDLDVTLTHVPSGISVVLFTDVGGTDEGFLIRLDDEAGTDIGTADNPMDGAIAGTFNPEGTALLSAFDGLDASGDWTLIVTDDNPAGGDIGTLFGWSLHVTY